MATTADFRNGLCIIYNDQPHLLISFQHVKPGKGGAFVRTKLKNLVTNRVIEHTFNAGVKITTARVEQRECQFLYQDGTHYHVMDKQTFETYAVEAESIQGRAFLKEGDLVFILIHQETDQLLGCELPASVWLEVTHAEAGAKGNTATKAMKPATLETGAEVQVPLFIKTGDILKIDTRTGTYMERYALGPK